MHAAMADYQKRLYMIVFPINALVASQLEPADFAQHYTIGSARHFQGKVIFAELDPTFRDEYFHIEDYLAETVSHPDGSPKRTKFIRSYNVLEHVPLTAVRKLYLVTPSGKALELSSSPYTAENAPGLIRIYQEITPVTNLIASRLDQRSFGNYITDDIAKGAPTVCFTQIDLNIEEFLTESRNREIISSPIPDNNPYRLLDCLLEMQREKEKPVKTISLSSVLHGISYRVIRHGFWFFDRTHTMLFFPMPSLHELETTHYDWWKNAR
jgi:hypothetical protein